MSKIDITKKTQKQIERIIRKEARAGNTHIDFEEDYNIETRKTKYYLIANTWARPTLGGSVTIVEGTNKKEIDEAISYSISRMVKLFTGEKFEFEWPEDDNVITMIDAIRWGNPNY